MENKELIKHWLDNLLLDEHREIYNAMTKEQQRIVLFALKYNSKER